MRVNSGNAVVLLVVVVLCAGVFHALSELRLFGFDRPEAAKVVTCSGDRIELDGVQAELLRLHNEERAGHGAPALCWDEELAAAATAHSEDMMERAYYDHESPEGVEPSDRTLAAGYESSFVAENIHRTYLSAGSDAKVRDLETVVRDWMESPGHRRNLLDPRLREVGIGVAYGHFGYKTDRSGTYTVNFGTPLDQVQTSR